MQGETGARTRILETVAAGKCRRDCRSLGAVAVHMSFGEEGRSSDMTVEVVHEQGQAGFSGGWMEGVGVEG